MDLSKLSDSDLQALQAGDMTKVSDAGLQELHNQMTPSPFADENPLQALGHVGIGNAELLGAGAANLAGGAVNAVHDIYHRLTTGDNNTQPIVPHIPAGQAGQDVLGALQNIPGVSQTEDLAKTGLGAIEDKFGENSADFRGDLVRNGLQVMGDFGSLAPVSHLITNPISAATTAAEGAGTDWHGIGLRTGAGHPIARAIEDDPAALKMHNEQIGNQVASSEAGTDISQPVDYNALADARAAPNSVYNRLANAFGEGAPVDLNADDETRGAIQTAGTRDNALVAKSEAAQQQIAAQKQLLLEAPMSGDSLINTMRALRQQGFKNAGSAVVAEQELGNAQLDMASALENHVGNNLPAGGDVDLPQFQAARQALAKNYAVEGALHGNDIDTQALAQIQRNNPTQLSGGLKILADFANGPGRDVTGLAPKFAQPSYPNDLATAINLHRPITHFVGGFGGRAIARRLMTGGTQNGLEAAAAQFPTRDPGLFAPKDPIGGPLYDDDLRRYTTGTGIGPGSDPGSGIPLSELLSHGVEQPGAPGLSLGPMGIRSDGIPFSAPPESVGARFTQGGSPSLGSAVDDYGNHLDLSRSNDPGAQWEATPAVGQTTLGNRIAGPSEGGFDPRQTGAVGAEGRVSSTPVLDSSALNQPGVGPGVPGGDVMAAGSRSDASQPWLAGGPGRNEGDIDALMRLLTDLQGGEQELPKKRPK